MTYDDLKDDLNVAEVLHVVIKLTPSLADLEGRFGKDVAPWLAAHDLVDINGVGGRVSLNANGKEFVYRLRLRCRRILLITGGKAVRQ